MKHLPKARTIFKRGSGEEKLGLVNRPCNPVFDKKEIFFQKVAAIYCCILSNNINLVGQIYFKLFLFAAFLKAKDEIRIGKAFNDNWLLTISTMRTIDAANNSNRNDRCYSLALLFDRQPPPPPHARH